MINRLRRVPMNLRFGLNEAGRYFLTYNDGGDAVAVTLSEDESAKIRQKINEEKPKPKNQEFGKGLWVSLMLRMKEFRQQPQKQEGRQTMHTGSLGRLT